LKVFKKIVFIFSILLSMNLYAQTSVEKNEVIHLTVHTTINPAVAEYVLKGLSLAESSKASAIVITLNTPGGLITSMQSVVEGILKSKVPVFVFVSPSGGGAISAGVFITMAAHVAGMAPGTTIGAAHPVSSNGENIGEDMRHKAENFAASLVKAIAEQRGRNVQWAEKAVRESVALTDIEAVKEKVVDFTVENIYSLFDKAKGKKIKLQSEDFILPDLRNAKLIEIPMSFQQKVVSVISDPNIMAILSLLAMGGIMAELYNPGLILPGLVGLISLILTLVAAQVIPINMGGVSLLLLGAILISAEMFVPSFGLLGVSGIVCLVLGSIYAIDTDQIWGAESMHIDPIFIGSIAGILGLLLLGMVYLFITSRKIKVAVGSEALVGKFATVDREFLNLPNQKSATSGKVKLRGEIWNAYCEIEDGKPILGSEVVVLKVEGLTLRVKPVE
jgi:membrane-bound serine protease (ClpP class)